MINSSYKFITEVLVMRNCIIFTGDRTRKTWKREVKSTEFTRDRKRKKCMGE
jgi:hypothetical protein